jgi:EAL domain-containing protein (putative c-di-GMP-specific phosphodiesterase class I)
MEALLRWNHPERGIIGPEIFIPLAERFGLINGLGNWVINEVCRQMGAWSREGTRMSVAINLSMHQLRQDEFADSIRQALKRYQLEPSQLICELTESVAMKDVEATQKFFKKLAAIGVRLSIDDFGTGHSSLSYLRQLPARQLKIDRSFINDLETNSDARAIVKAVINLAHVLDLSVVAEGVETEGQRRILEELKCDELQGFFFSRPMLEDKMLMWVDKQEAAATSKEENLDAWDGSLSS